MIEVGSLVESLIDFKIAPGVINCPQKGVIYTVREIVYFGGENTGILLEEIINPLYDWEEGFLEASFNISRFREIQPPMTIKIEDIISQPELV